MEVAKRGFFCFANSNAYFSFVFVFSSFKIGKSKFAVAGFHYFKLLRSLTFRGELYPERAVTVERHFVK